MDIVIDMRDVLRDVIACIHRRFPDHGIVRFAETMDEETARGLPIFARDCHRDFPIEWHFQLEKNNPQAPGPAKIDVRINPLVEVIMGKGPEDTVFEFVPDPQANELRVEGADGPVWNGSIHYQIDYAPPTAKPRQIG